MFGVRCRRSGWVAAAAGLSSLAVAFGLVSVVSGLAMLFGGSKNAAGASETGGQQHKRPVDSSHNNTENTSGLKPSYPGCPLRPTDGSQNVPLPTLYVPFRTGGNGQEILSGDAKAYQRRNGRK